VIAFPQYTARERLADGCIHVLGVGASIVAFLFLILIGVESQVTLWAVSLAIYGGAMVTTFSCSAGYNLTVRPPIKAIFRRLDHAAIFLMIAGTYTPFALIKMDWSSGLLLLGIVWIIAVIGIVLKLFTPRRLEGLSVGLYLIQGWAVLAAWDPLVSSIPHQAALLLLIGGALYTVGVAFHLWQRLPYQNAIWHAFVLVAAGCHYAAVLSTVQS
jgi:hemolysin III